MINLNIKTIICGAVILTASQATAETLIGTASVIDGDTLEIHGERIRLAGIDAPESAQSCYYSNGEAWRCGQAAALAVSDFIGRKTVECKSESLDRYGRHIATCYLDGSDINALIVASGLAVAYRKYSALYIAQENAAKAAQIGIWNGEFIYPWDWRKGARINE
jgi:endonuclease YncB( thermonuclease family)